MGTLGNRSKFSPEVRERSVRLAAETRAGYPSGLAEILSVAEKLGCSREMIRRTQQAQTAEVPNALWSWEVTKRSATAKQRYFRVHALPVTLHGPRCRQFAQMDTFASVATPFTHLVKP